MIASTPWARHRSRAGTAPSALRRSEYVQIAQRVGAGRVERVAQGLDVCRVPGHDVGPVEDDRNQRTAGVAHCAGSGRGPLPARSRRPARPRADRRRRRSTAACRTGTARGWPCSCGPPAARYACACAATPVGTDDAATRSGSGARLAARRDERDGARRACAAKGCEAVGPCLDAAEQADRNEVDAVERRDAIDAIRMEPAHRADVGSDIVDHGTKREKLGVRVRTEQDHVSASSLCHRGVARGSLGMQSTASSPRT